MNNCLKLECMFFANCFICLFKATFGKTSSLRNYLVGPMGNAESNPAADRHNDSGKLRLSKKGKKKDRRSCSEHLEQYQVQINNNHRDSTEQQQHNRTKQCHCCEGHQKQNGKGSIPVNFIRRMPRRLVHKASEDTAVSACCCCTQQSVAPCVPRMAEDTVAMSRTTVTSATVEERVAVAAAATAVRWHDLNGASLATAGVVLSAAVSGTVNPKRRGGSERNGGTGVSSTKSDGTAQQSDGTPSVAFGVVANRPDAVAAALLADSLGDNASLDETNLASSGASTFVGGVRLGDGIRRQRPAGRSFDGRRAKSFRLQQLNGRGGPHLSSSSTAALSHCQPSTTGTLGVVRPRLPLMTNGAIEQHLGMPCPVTALTLAQKRLILARWRQLSDADMLRLSENIFERTFRRNESFAKTLLRQADKNWKGLPQFRVLTMRFSNALSALCASLEDDATPGAELLAEFGAQHALGLDNGQIIPPSFWDVLLLAICEAAGAGEGQQQIECFAPAGCALSVGSSLSASSSGVSSSPSVTSGVVPAPPMLLPQWTRRSADAWAQFAVFVSAQMRFGYEMERFLRERMRKRIQEKGLANRRRSLSANGSLRSMAKCEGRTAPKGEGEAEGQWADNKQ